MLRRDGGAAKTSDLAVDMGILNDRARLRQW